MMDAAAGQDQMLVVLGGGLSIWMAWVSLVPLLQVRASQSWQSTPGTVTGSDPSEGSWILERPRQRYSPDVRYTYRVGGTDYEATRLFFGMTRTSRYNAQVMSDRFPPGTKVLVYYNTSNPRDAVLERSTSWGTLGTVVMLIFAIAMGAIVIKTAANM